MPDQRPRWPRGSPSAHRSTAIRISWSEPLSAMGPRTMASAGLDLVHHPRARTLAPWSGRTLPRTVVPSHSARSRAPGSRACHRGGCPGRGRPRSPSGSDRWRLRWLAADQALVADPHPDRVEDHQRGAGVERAALPLRRLLQDRARHRRDQVRRHLDAVDLIEMTAGSPACSWPARVHRHDLVVEVRDAPLRPGDQLQVERAGPIARDVERHLRRPHQ